MFKSKKGFTLVELLIVIAIIGILAGIVLAVINPLRQRDRATQAAVRTYMAKVCLALSACINSTTDGNCTTAGNLTVGTLPANMNALTIPATVTTANTISATMTSPASCSVNCVLSSGAITLTGTGCVE